MQPPREGAPSEGRATSTPRAKRKVAENIHGDQHDASRRPTKKQRRATTDQHESLQNRSEGGLEASRGQGTLGTDNPLIRSSSRAGNRNEVLEPVNNPRDRHLQIVTMSESGNQEKALVLDKTLITLFKTLIEAERDHMSHIQRGENNRVILADFCEYARGELKRLGRAEWILGTPPYQRSELQRVRDIQTGLRDDLEAAGLEEENLRSCVTKAAAFARNCYFEVLCPLEDALMEEELLADEADLPETNSLFEQRFAIPPTVDRFEMRARQDHDKRARSHQPRPPSDVDVPAYGATDPPGDDLEYGEAKCYGFQGEYQRQPASDHVGSEMPVDNPGIALREVRSRQRELKRAERALEDRRRETGTDYFLRHKGSNKRLQYDSPLDYDQRHLANHSALTRDVSEAERKLAEAIAAAHALNVDITTSSQTSNFNDADGDVGSGRRLSHVYHAAVGVRTEQIDQFLASLPAIAIQDGPLIEDPPELPELDDWTVAPVGNYDSSSLVDVGRHKKRINGEKRAAEERRVAAMDEWGGRYPRRNRAAFDR